MYGCYFDSPNSPSDPWTEETYRHVNYCHAAWPLLPLHSQYLVSGPTPSNLSCPRAVLPTAVRPQYESPVILGPDNKEISRFYMDRSVFNLVDVNSYLPLTDPNLQDWYIHLSPEDRKIIQDEGGFQQFLMRHHALVSRFHHVCAKCSPHQNFNMEMLPRNVSETLGLPRSSVAESEKHRDSKQALYQSNYREKLMPVAPLFQLDGDWPSGPMDGGIFSGEAKQEQYRALGSQNPNLSPAPAGPSQWPMMESRSTSGDGATDEAQNDIYDVMADDKSILAFVGAQNHEVHPGPISTDSEEPAARSETSVQSERMNNLERSTSPVPWPLTCDLIFDTELPLSRSTFTQTEDSGTSDLQVLTKLHLEDLDYQAEVQPGPISTDSEAPAASSKTSGQSEKLNSAERSISPVPCLLTGEIMVGTELRLSKSTFTQTEDSGTSEKHVLTELHMEDLDYLAEKYKQLQKVREEQTLQAEKMKCLACKLRQECELSQQAELFLLDVEYHMCRQKILRPTTLPEIPPVNLRNLLEKLECDYDQLSNQIQVGVPLEQLKLLSVDSENIPPGAGYTPIQIFADMMKRVQSCYQGPQQTSRGEAGGGYSHQVSLDAEEQQGSSRSLYQGRDVVPHPNIQEEKQKSICNQVITGEAWYDAEEDLEPSGPAAAAENTGKDFCGLRVVSTDQSSAEAQGSGPPISILPENDVTQGEALLCFEEHHPTEAAAPTSDLRVTMALVCGAMSAELIDRTSHEEIINQFDGGSSASISGPQSSADTEPSTTERTQVEEPPLISSIKTRMLVCGPPTAEGALEFHHYCIMGGFHTLMAELRRHHPQVGRQRMVEALMELRTKQQGRICGLPLGAVVEMTSDLLSRPSRTMLPRGNSGHLFGIS